MFLTCFGVYQNVVNINTNNPFHDKVVKDFIHHCLEGGWQGSESEEHHQWFKESPISPKHSLPLVALFDEHIIVTPPNI